MTRRILCNEDMKLRFVNFLGPPDIVYTGNIGLSAQVTTTQSRLVQAPPGKDTCTKDVTCSWTAPASQCPHTSVTYDFITGTNTIIPTPAKTKIEGEDPILRLDGTTCAGTWKLKVSPFTVIPCGCTVDAGFPPGQTKVLCR